MCPGPPCHSGRAKARPSSPYPTCCLLRQCHPRPWQPHGCSKATHPGACILRGKAFQGRCWTAVCVDALKAASPLALQGPRVSICTQASAKFRGDPGLIEDCQRLNRRPGEARIIPHVRGQVQPWRALSPPCCPGHLPLWCILKLSVVTMSTAASAKIGR